MHQKTKTATGIISPNSHAYYMAIVVLLLSFSCQTQQAITAKSDTRNIPGWTKLADHVAQLYVDKLQQIYILYTDGKIEKRNTELLPEFEYTNRNYSTVASMDVTNPLQLVVYYPDFQQVLLLDNTLGEIARFDLAQLDLSEQFAIALSNDNQIWVYDDIESRLKKINQQAEVLIQSEDMKIFFYGYSPRADQLFERSNQVYLFDQQKGLYIFDNLGRYFKHISEIKGGYLYFKNNMLVHVDSTVHLWDLELRKIQDITPKGIAPDFDFYQFTDSYEFILVDESMYYRAR